MIFHLTPSLVLFPSALFLTLPSSLSLNYLPCMPFLIILFPFFSRPFSHFPAPLLFQLTADPSPLANPIIPSCLFFLPFNLRQNHVCVKGTYPTLLHLGAGGCFSFVFMFVVMLVTMGLSVCLHLDPEATQTCVPLPLKLVTFPELCSGVGFERVLVPFSPSPLL